MESIKTILILVTKVESCSKGKGSWLKITDGEGKATNIFPGTPGYNHIAQGKTLKITLEKKEGEQYWNVINIADTAPTPSNPPPDQKLPQNGMTGSILPAVYNDPRQSSIVKQSTMKMAVDLIMAGKIEIIDLYNAAHDFEGYINGTHNPAHKNDWFIRYLK